MSVGFRNLPKGGSWPTSYYDGEHIVEQEPDVLIFSGLNPEEVDSIYSILGSHAILAVRVSESHILEGRLPMPFIVTKDGGHYVGLDGITAFAEEASSNPNL